MSLQLIFGGSGSGKSDYVYRNLLKRSKSEEDKTFFVLVPEQFTMQTQRELVRRQENHSIMNVDVEYPESYSETAATAPHPE